MKAAEAVAPGFDFPFYGHVVSKFYITTHGFLSFAPRNEWLPAAEMRLAELIGSLKLGSVRIFVQLNYRQTRTKNQLYKNPNIA